MARLRVKSSRSKPEPPSTSNSFGPALRKAKLALIVGSIIAILRSLEHDLKVLFGEGSDFKLPTNLGSYGTSLVELLQRDLQDKDEQLISPQHSSDTFPPSDRRDHYTSSNATIHSINHHHHHQAHNNAMKHHKSPTTTTMKSQNLPSYPTTTEESSFPTTPFTAHVQGVLSVIESVTLHAPPNRVNPPFAYDPTAECPERSWSFHIVLDQPYSPPSRIECSKSVRGKHWCTNFLRLFQNTSRIIPFNLTFGIHGGDFITPNVKAYGQCIGSSSPDGKFLMHNYEESEIQEEHISGKNQTLNKVRGMRSGSHHAKGMLWDHSLPWEERQTIPVFRGHPRMEFQPWNRDPSTCPDSAEKMGHRMKAAAFSLQHPNLLDAVLRKQDNVACSVFNATNGMDQIFRWGKYSENAHQLTPQRIPAQQYYTNYQTALVLGGWGAAFRTASHLSAGQAVVLQDFLYQEWFIHLMKPYVHYIPLARDLSNLKEVMEWVQGHPAEVKQIAENGQAFYWQYLSFDKFQEHWYELLWRLSLLLKEKGQDRQEVWNAGTTWNDKSGPYMFQRTATGTFEPVAR